jgi:hypothetical protein
MNAAVLDGVGGAGQSRGMEDGAPLRWLGSILFGLGMASCIPLGNGRPEDSTAPQEYRASMRPRELCAPEVELIRSASSANRPYREVASLSASCYPGVLSECERRLLDRACELKAQAIILTEGKAEGAPPGGTTDSRVVRSAIAVRWVEPALLP